MEDLVKVIEDCPKSSELDKLLNFGLNKGVAAKLNDIYKSGKLNQVDLDGRALEALKEFPIDGALAVLEKFLESNFDHISNKSAYLCSIMKTYRQKNTMGSNQEPSTFAQTGMKGPDQIKIKEVLDRTGYTLDITAGQRKYGGPPPKWEGPAPADGCEIFCGKIPRDMYEDELVPMFEKCGEIWDLRLMMDPLTGVNRGYAFVTFTNHEGALRAVKELDNRQIAPGRVLKINLSVPNRRLFVGNIPKSKNKNEIYEEFNKLTAGLKEVIIYSSPDDANQNRGFCFLDYESHKLASLAKRRLGTGRLKVWGCDLLVDWADPQENPDEDTMSKVKILYVRNLTQCTSERRLKDAFEKFGGIERVKRIKDYAFVHFIERGNALKAMEELNGKEIDGSKIEVTLAKPPSDKKKKEDMLRARERRMMQQRTSMMPTNIPLRGPGPQATRGIGINRGPAGRGDYNYNFDDYGYRDYRGGYNDPYYDDNYQYEEHNADFPTS